MERIVGIGEYVISNQKEDIIKTFALASCVAVTIYCSRKGIAGMIHIALPSKPMSENNINRIGYFADTGLPIFINKVIYQYGCTKNDLSIGIYGGANSIQEDIFKIGLKNVIMVKKILRDFNLSYSTDDTGDFISRTLYMDVATGDVKTSKLPIII